MKCEFCYQDESSNKYWKIECSGSSVITENGRVGTKPRRTENSFASEDEAQKDFEKQIRAKLSKGYKECPVSEIPEYEQTDWTVAVMNDETFWRIISLFNWKKEGDDDAVLKPALKALCSMNAENIIEFEEILSEKLFALDTRAIAKVCYKGEDEYFSGDDFLYSRCVVVANGKNFYESVLADPKNMPTELEFESLLALAENAFEKKTGQVFDHVTKYSYETCSNEKGWEK
jgi:predicted DNA-binding WGR domain protein